MTLSQHPHATRLTLREVLPLLPGSMRHLSIARNQILLDQIRGLVERGLEQQLLATAVMAPSRGPTSEVAAFTVAVKEPQSETACLLFAGPTERFGHAMAESKQRIAATLAVATDQMLRSSGVRFVQWPTDPFVPTEAVSATEGVASPSDIDSTGSIQQPGCRETSEPAGFVWWAKQLGLREIGTLEYLSKDLESNATVAIRPAAGSELAVELLPVDWTIDNPLGELAPVVERTYLGTLDCPRLGQIRSAAEIIEGYRQSPAFDPDGWYLVCEPPSRGAGIGALILARHRSSTEVDDAPGFVAELVYMGLVPEVRGRRLSRPLFEEAIRRVTASGAMRMILAVDECNTPAKRTYLGAGFRSLMRETVFVKSLE